VSVAAPDFTDPRLLAVADMADVAVPRGEPRRLLAALVDALASRAPFDEVDAKLAAVAGALVNDETRERVERALVETAPDDLATELGTAGAPGVLALALAYRAALPLLARDERIRAPLEELESSFAELDDDDRARFGPVLARAATPALGVDVALMKDEGYGFVAIYPPEGSEGVDIVGRAARWLTRLMTMDGDAPRQAMRRFLALLAEEVEVDLPVTSGTIDRLLAEPVPEAPQQDALFVALARGLVEEAVAERGFPF
jgi:hypothetical protein